MKYYEIFKLHDMLEGMGIPHEIQHPVHDGARIIYPGSGKEICSVVEHCFSYGHNEDLLEIRGLLTPKEKRADSVVGSLSAKEVFGRIMQDWGKRNEG